MGCQQKNAWATGGIVGLGERVYSGRVKWQGCAGTGISLMQARESCGGLRDRMGREAMHASMQW